MELIDSDIKDKTIIFSTTNGTVALKNSLDASFVYAACLLNGASVAQYLLKSHRDKSLLLVCSGNHGRFSMEDLIGAGHLINALHRNTDSVFHLSDAAILAYKFYQQCQQNQIVEYLLTSQTGKLLTSIGYERSIFHAAQRDIYPIVPVVRKGDYPYLEIAGS